MRVVVLAMTFLFTFATAVAAGDALDEQEKEFPLRPAFRHLREDLDFPPVERTNDTFPLSDQENKRGWERYEPMWDEFEGDSLDESKWHDHNPTWKGRQPGFFYTRNVAVKDGKLHLTMKKEEAPEMPEGYHTYTSAAVKSKTTTRYGYYEIKARAMDSAGSSAFWFYRADDDRWTEIDVFEIGCSPKHEKRLFMTVHVFRTPEEKKHWSRGGNLIAPNSLADDYHVYGLEWNKDVLRYYFDGVLVREGNNTHWHQDLHMNFDSETFPDWFGLPEDKDLPSTFSIEYVRAWKQKK